MEESQELDLPEEIADDTGTNAETVNYDYEGIDPGLEICLVLFSNNI